MTATSPPPDDRTLECPGCAHGHVRGTGTAVCSWKRCVVEIVRFPIVVDVVPEAGVGRCSRHPAKDGIAACDRCGGFVCDVCATRTGERVLCPACFDLLHSRAELETTKTSRFRVDQLALTLALVSCLCYGVSLPFALGLGIWGLRRSRTEAWISKGYCWAAVILTSVYLLAGAGLIAFALTRKGD